VLPRFSSADAVDAIERAVQLARGSLHALSLEMSLIARSS